MDTATSMELVCPAGNLPSLKAAVDNGANAVYTGFRDDTNARHFAGLNFTPKKLAEGIRYARRKGVRVFIALNTYPRRAASALAAGRRPAADLGVDALIAADIGVLDYAGSAPPGAEPAPVGAGLGHQLRGAEVLSRALRRAPRGAAAGAVHEPDPHVIEHSPVEIEVFASAACA
jgi:hypothetical protein